MTSANVCRGRRRIAQQAGPRPALFLSARAKLSSPDALLPELLTPDS